MKLEKSVQESVIDLGRLARSSVEHIVVVAMFEGMFPTHGRIDKLCTWLLVVSGSVSVVVLHNADKLVPILGKFGFLTCGVLLALSSLCGLMAKMLIAWFAFSRASPPRSLAAGRCFARFQAVLFLAFLGSGFAFPATGPHSDVWSAPIATSNKPEASTSVRCN